MHRGCGPRRVRRALDRDTTLSHPDMTPSKSIGANPKLWHGYNLSGAACYDLGRFKNVDLYFADAKKRGAADFGSSQCKTYSSAWQRLAAPLASGTAVLRRGSVSPLPAACGSRNEKTPSRPDSGFWSTGRSSPLGTFPSAAPRPVPARWFGPPRRTSR